MKRETLTTMFMGAALVAVFGTESAADPAGNSPNFQPHDNFATGPLMAGLGGLDEAPYVPASETMSSDESVETIAWLLQKP